MAERYQRRSALAHLGLEARASVVAGEGGVTLGEAPMRGLLVLRGDSGDQALRSAVAATIGLEPVAEPLTAARRRGLSILWLGPDEWLVVTPDRRRARIERALRDALTGQHAAVTDVSHGRVILVLSGPDAPAVLAKGCSLDLHPRRFGSGRCAQSRLAKCQALIHQTGDAPEFEIYVQRSFAQYAWTWLEDAGREFGLRIVSVE